MDEQFCVRKTKLRTMRGKLQAYFLPPINTKNDDQHDSRGSWSKYLETERILTYKQKGSRMGCQRKKVQLLTVKAALRDCKRVHTNLVTSWIDYKKYVVFHRN